MTNAVESTHQQRREVTRQRLLEAAAQVFAEVGMDAASVEAVCERAGFTRGAFYSNFASKDELFLELAGMFARKRVDAADRRAHELSDSRYHDLLNDPVAIVQHLMDVSNADRSGTLLMTEIRIRALRVPEVAVGFLAQEQELAERVADTIRDIVELAGLTLRVPAVDAASLLNATFENASMRAVMAGLDHAEMVAAVGEAVGMLARLLIED